MNINEFVKKASSASTLLGAEYIKKNIISSNQFVSLNNPLRFEPFEALRDHFSTPPVKKIKVVDAQTYLAASVFLHCMDGWNYLARSVDCLMSGDTGAAIHMAYYAELRATISFLASEGMGVVNGKNFCIDGTSQIALCAGNNPTHDFTWKAIEHWIKDPTKNVNSLSDYFKINNKPFSEWIQAMSLGISTPVWNLYLKKWLEEWNFDVKSFSEDRSGRNLSSYNPQRVYNTSPIDYKYYIDNLSDFWGLLEPNTNSDFNLLDRYLFKILLETISKKIKVSLKKDITPEQLAKEAASRLGVSLDNSVLSILRKSGTHPLFGFSKQPIFSTPKGGAINIISILSRALLMLRVASGAAKHLSNISKLSVKDFQFYWEPVGLDNGFWEEGNTPSSLFDLWIDVEDSIFDLNEAMSTITPPINLKKIVDEYSQQLTVFKQLNRAGLWNMAN